MAPSHPRLVRRSNLFARVKGYLNPWDFLLWASEELNGNDWEDFHKQWAIPIGVVMNFIFMMARSNSTGNRGGRGDDVFGDNYGKSGSGWLTWFASFVVHFLTLFSVLNAIYTFTRKRHYRLFEASIDAVPSTPSARRVRVDSSPLSSSPLRFLSNIIAATTAEARAHQDTTRDVWELAVWDPTPLCLRLFALFSPGHVLIYWLFFPVAPFDPQPSVTVATTIFLSALLSAQLMLQQSYFSRQSKDTSLIHKEVQHEYDTKFVNPSLNRPVRNVGTQILSEDTPKSTAEVTTYTPITFVNRGFRTNPNPNYASHYDPDGLTANLKDPPNYISRSSSSPKWHTPEPITATAFASSLRATQNTPIRPPQFRTSSAAPPTGDGGTFGIHNHAYSPLKRPGSLALGRSSFGGVRESSPLKRSSTPGVGASLTNGVNVRDRLSHLHDARSGRQTDRC